MSNRFASFCLVAAIVAASAVLAHAQAIQVDVTSPTDQVTVTGSSLLDLGENLIQAQDEFQVFENQNASATFKYLDVPNAVVLSRNATGTSATLSIPLTGFSRTFTADDEDELQDEIEDFLKEDGAEEWARFLQEINQRSALAIVDGNPQATTTFFASNAFQLFGLNSTISSLDQQQRSTRPDYQFRVDFSGGTFEADEGEGTYGSVAIANHRMFTDWLGLSLAVPFRYRQIEDADVFDAGWQLGLPLLLVAPKGSDNGVVWQVTPFLSGGVGVSPDLLAGGVLLGGGVTSSLGLHFDGWAIVLGNQFTVYEGQPVEYDDYEFDTEVSQQIVKNGIQVIKTLGNAFYIDGGITHTALLDDAAIDSYISPEAGFGLRFGSASGLRIAYRGDYGDDFTTHSGNINLYFAR